MSKYFSRSSARQHGTSAGRAARTNKQKITINVLHAVCAHSFTGFANPSVAAVMTATFPARRFAMLRLEEIGAHDNKSASARPLARSDSCTNAISERSSPHRRYTPIRNVQCTAAVLWCKASNCSAGTGGHAACDGLAEGDVSSSNRQIRDRWHGVAA